MKKFFASRFWMDFGVGIIMGVLALGLFLGVSIMQGQWQKELAEMDVTINDTVMSTRPGLDTTNRDVTPNYTVTGLDLTRKDKDDRIAADVFTYATTWSSVQTYMSQRDHLVKKYTSLDEGSQFLTEFFPPIDRIVIRDASGTVIRDPFSEGINLQFSYMDTYVLNISDEDVYSYFAKISVNGSGPAGGTSSGQFVATYDIDANGVISNVFCYTLAN